MRRDTLRFVFAFLVVFGGMLFLVKPDPNAAQTGFRVSLVAVGLIGLAVLQSRGR